MPKGGSATFRQWLRHFSVARVPSALGQEIFLRSPSTKTTEYEVKNRCKRTKEAKVEHLLWSFFTCFRVIKHI